MKNELLLSSFSLFAFIIGNAQNVGIGTTSMGLATVSGYGSLAAGLASTANGIYSIAIGQSANAQGNYSIAIGTR